MTKLAREVDLLQKKIRLIEENYSIVSSILNDNKITTKDLLDKYKSSLMEKNKKRMGETRQMEIDNENKI